MQSNRKYYAKFWHLGAISKLPIPACGSDSIFYLDGRLSKGNMISAAKRRMTMLNGHLNKQYVGITIHNKQDNVIASIGDVILERL